MDLFEIIGYTFLALSTGLMIRFVASCWQQMKMAITGYQFFTAVLGLVAGIVFFPITIIFQLFIVSFGD